MALRIVFFGTPLFAASILEFLFQKPIEIVAIVTKPDKPKGRDQLMQSPAVKILSQKQKPSIPVFQPVKASSPEFAEILKGFKADLFVVVAYSEIIKQNLLEMPKFGCINIHASLLPKFRGAAPIQRSLIEGEKETGVTIVQMVKELDAGDMLAMRKVEITDEMNAGELSEKLCELGKELVWEVIQKYQSEKITPIAQNHLLATFAPKIKSEDAEIKWSKSATEIHNLIRGMTPKPGAWCHMKIREDIKRVIIKKTRVENKNNSFFKPGALLEQEGLVVACGEGSLRLLEIQVEGKKSLSAEEFQKGTPKEFLKLMPDRN